MLNRQTKKYWSLPSIFLWSVVLCLISLNSRADVAQVLDPLQWNKRVIILFGASEANVHFQEQKREFTQNTAGFKDREITLIEVTYGNKLRIDNVESLTASDQDFRKTFRVADNQFMIVLIGKDGSEKFRSSKFVPMKTLNEIIDDMPMRQDEMKE